MQQRTLLENLVMKNRILPVFITFAGCTSRCVYCNQHRITGVRPSNVISSARQQISECLSMDAKWTELAFYGGSFSCLPDGIRSELYKLAKETGINTLRFSTSPDCINQKILDESVRNGVKTIELGVQSLDDTVLKANKRPYLASECEAAFAHVKTAVEHAGIQLMTGLYKEDFNSFAKTVDRAVMMRADYARIYPTVVIEETELADLWRTGEYVPLTLADAVARCAYGFILLSASGCDVIRVGLHDSLSVRESALAGAYHPAMGDMVKTVVVQTFINTMGEICVDQRYLNVAYGYGGYLKKLYRENVFIKEGVKPDFKDMSKEIVRVLSEDYKRKLQEQTACYAERLVDSTNNR